MAWISCRYFRTLAGFLRLAGGPQVSDPSTSMRPALDGAYALGQGEARSGRGDRLDDPSQVLDIRIPLQPKTVDNPDRVIPPG